MELKIQRIDKTLPLPRYPSDGAAGIDIYAAEDMTIFSKDPTAVPTGIKVQVEQGYEIQVRPRSGLSAKEGITVVNSPGTIDSDYRGEVFVILQIIGDDLSGIEKSYNITKGERIAQLVVKPAPQAQIIEVEELNKTIRGEGRFGSTGK